MQIWLSLLHTVVGEDWEGGAHGLDHTAGICDGANVSECWAIIDE